MQLTKLKRKKSYLALFLDEKMQKNLLKTHFENIGASNLRFIFNFSEIWTTNA
jgi:hypothetical protein